MTDGEGRYSIVDLRPGTYNVVFTLTGFNAFRREGIELPTNFTMTINAELRVGALEESVTVTGDAPSVDVQSTQRTHVLNRDLLDSLPTGRNYSGLAALMPGVRMSNTDVGGNQQMEQIYMRVHGSRQTDTTVQVDGMQLNSLMSDGQVQAYYSDAANAEVSYQTSGVGAEVSAGGLRINMIPKEGGNRVSGSAFAGGIHRAGRATTSRRNCAPAASTAATPSTMCRTTTSRSAVRSGRTGSGISRRCGGLPPTKSSRTTSTRDGRQGIEDQWIYNLMGRLTYQANRQDEDHGLFRSLPQVQGARDGRAHRSGHGRPPARMEERAVLHHADQGDVDALQPAAPRGRLLEQRRVLHRQVPARHREGARDAGMVLADRS